MPTPLDRATQSKNAFLAFAGIITAVAAWSIWGSDTLFPQEPDPTGDPNTWTIAELQRWLRARNLQPSKASSKAELVERVRANMRPTLSNERGVDQTTSNR